jgi:hypothetical protein
MNEVTMSSVPGWKLIVGTSLLATAWALIVMLGVAALLMAMTLVGFVVVVIIAMEPVRFAGIILQGFVLVGPITLGLLPLLTLLCYRWPRLLRWLLLLASPLTGGWWGGLVGLWWFDEGRSLEAFLAILGMIGGLTGSIVFARRIRRHTDNLIVTCN